MKWWHLMGGERKTVEKLFYHGFTTVSSHLLWTRVLAVGTWWYLCSGLGEQWDHTVGLTFWLSCSWWHSKLFATCISSLMSAKVFDPFFLTEWCLFTFMSSRVLPHECRGQRTPSTSQDGEYLYSLSRLTSLELLSYSCVLGVFRILFYFSY